MYIDKKLYIYIYFPLTYLWHNLLSPTLFNVIAKEVHLHISVPVKYFYYVVYIAYLARFPIIFLGNDGTCKSLSLKYKKVYFKVSPF